MNQNPDKTSFLGDLDNAVDSFVDGKFDKVIAISHNDADGISSLQLILHLFVKMGIEYDYFIYNRSVSWANYLSGILSKRQSENVALVFTDVGSNLHELIPIIKSRKEKFFILDHHEVDANYRFALMPENLYFVNPTIYGFDGLEHIAGATVAYMFAKRIKPSLIKLAWLAIIGIAGDSLMSTDNLQSFNKEVYQEVLDEEIIQEKRGLILFGAMFDSIKNSLKYSILPFLKDLGGESDQTVKSFLSNHKINPKKKVIDLGEDEINILAEKTGAKIGNFAFLHQKQGMLQFTFEHALLLNILCFKNISAALSIIQLNKVTRYAKDLYFEYIDNLTKNMKILSTELPRLETNKAIFIDVLGKIPPSSWSDTASFSSVNDLLDPTKVLVLGGEEQKSRTIKLSIRCSRQFLEKNHGEGVNKLIERIKADFGGMGGGHKLAGGIRLSKPSYNLLKSKIDDYI
ncbi:MAG: DHH family phosphoesterase [Candidatus Lokiarchaeota archaeon]|nr:DHH family phosphoesterase [Candidatus Lokiarchaeota archaeon]